MGRKRITKALHDECHGIAETLIVDLTRYHVQRAMEAGQHMTAAPLHEFVEMGVAEGLEVGLRVAIADIAAGRRLLDAIGSMSDGGGTRDENAARLLRALSN